MGVIAIIGDLVDSKQAPERGALQARLSDVLREISEDHPTLASPYTITLGDEFQAVYVGADRIFADLLAIMRVLDPVRARFAIGVGSLTTDLNPDQALGMDGPAFHRARDAMDAMRRAGTRLRIGPEPADTWSFANHVLAYIGHQMHGWDANRFAILRHRLRGVAVADMLDDVGISRVAIYKNIRVAALDEIVAICRELTASLTEALADP